MFCSYADWLNTCRPMLDECLVGVAFVMPSVLVRGALTAIFWLSRLSAPHVVYKDLDDALGWALELARERKLPLCPALEFDGVEAFRSQLQRRIPTPSAATGG